RRPRQPDAAAHRSAARLPRFRRARPARTLAARAAAHAAPAELLGVDRAPLGRPGVSRRLPLVQHAALLAGPHSRTARADRADGRAAAQSCMNLLKSGVAMVRSR